MSYDADWGVATSKLNFYQETGKRETESTPTSSGNSRKPKIVNSVSDGIITVPLPRNMLSVGGQYQHGKLTDTSANYVGHSEHTVYQYAAFVENEFAILENLLLTLGMRMDEHETHGRHWSPRAYLVYHMTPELTFKGGVSKAFKAPSIRQISSGYGMSTQQGNGVLYGDPDLKPETSVSTEIGATYKRANGFSASLTLFHTDFKNKITNYSTNTIDPATGLWLWELENIGKARVKGIETGITIPLHEKLKLSANYTYMHSKRLQDGENFGNGMSTKGYPLTMTPKHKANVRLDWQATDSLNLYTRLDYTGEQVNAGARTGYRNGARYTSPMLTMDVGGTYYVNENVRISAAVLNVGDVRRNPNHSLNEHWEVIEDGRRFWLGLTVDF